MHIVVLQLFSQCLLVNVHRVILKLPILENPFERKVVKTPIFSPIIDQCALTNRIKIDN